MNYTTKISRDIHPPLNGLTVPTPGSCFSNSYPTHNDQPRVIVYAKHAIPFGNGNVTVGSGHPAQGWSMPERSPVLNSQNLRRKYEIGALTMSLLKT